jgi:GAF domain-containing protein
VTEDRRVDDALLREALAELARRVEIARRLSPPAGMAVLRSIAEATVSLFGAEAASIALHDPTRDRLVFEVAAGTEGQGVVGLDIGPGEGVAGYVYSTGQPIALSDVATDARFGRAAAEQTGYVPRSLVAVPLVDDDGILGVLEVLDKRGDGGFDLRDIELASVFARQATVAIRSSRIERDAAAFLRSVVLGVLAAESGSEEADLVGAERSASAIVGAALEAVAGDERDDRLWRLADEVARVRAASPADVDLVIELLDVLARRAERRGRSGDLGWQGIRPLRRGGPSA